MAKVLLVEDEKDIQELIKIQLELQGHQVTIIDRGDEAIEHIQGHVYDLYILDRMLPGDSGIEVCKFLRRLKKSSLRPILMLTALSRNSNIIEGLDAGADDYIPKPFDMNILLARVKALLRRSQSFPTEEGGDENILSLGPIRINKAECSVWVNDEKVHFTASEYKLLCILLENSRKVLGRKDLVARIQGENVHVTERTIDTHITGIRKKLNEAGKLIETIRGIGYRVCDDTFSS